MNIKKIEEAKEDMGQLELCKLILKESKHSRRRVSPPITIELYHNFNYKKRIFAAIATECNKIKSELEDRLKKY